MYSLELLLMDENTVRNIQCHSKLNKFEALVHLVGFTTEIHYDARPYERQICHSILPSIIYCTSRS